MAKAKAAKTKNPAKAKSIKFEDLPGNSDPTTELSGAQLLSAAQPVLAMLEKDLLARANSSAGVTRALKERYAEEKKAERTADSFVQWQGRVVTQVAASWLLSCVFVRTLEDRGLLGQARIAGPGAMDSQKLFFELSPSLTERDYLLTVFRELSRFPAAKDLFDAKHSLLWKLSPSANAAKLLLALFRSPNAETPAFRFGQASTRVLGDLYQDLSEDVRKRYALLQTPDFIESFILDRTLEPAIERFGLDDTTIIDPTCGSGHFLLGSFDRLFEHRLRSEPGIDIRQAAHKALDQVFGADINPYAVAIARFRLTLSYLEKAGFKKIADAPELPLHLVVADSLLHNPHQKQLDFEHQDAAERGQWRSSDVFALEDEAAARDVLHRQYAAVVGNPPYIVVKDSALREQYRAMYASCYRSYSLAVPFCERFFQLGRKRGYIGQITANSFMKREFGNKLIADYLPSVNLELIVNTSGAYIPGHGTPTVLLFGTQEDPQSRDVLTVLAKRGEPSTPNDPAKGEVWSSIAENWSELAFENDYISVAKAERNKLAEHPWSLAGGGATELKQLLEDRAERRLTDLGVDIGTGAVTREDAVFLLDAGILNRWGIPARHQRLSVLGENIRDWSISGAEAALWPYDPETLEPVECPEIERALWPWKAQLAGRVAFGKSQTERGLPWSAYSMFFDKRARIPLTIGFAEVVTHNHFVLDRGGKVFNRTAPIIKLPADATEDDHFALLAYLNSSTACFWMKQVAMNKGGSGMGRGIQDEAWEARYAFDGTKLSKLPLPPGTHRLVSLSRSATELASRAREDEVARDKLVAVQEKIDWLVYELFDLVEPGTASLVRDSLSPGLRAFEWKLAKSAPTTAWFSRNNYQRPESSMKGCPSRLMSFVNDIPELRLIELPDYKHRWTTHDLERSKSEAECRNQLGIAEDRMKSQVLPQPVSRLGIGDEILVEAVPFARACFLSEAGVKKMASWSETWARQRLEDAGENVEISVPPKYAKSDYRDDTYWRLRGKLDVPKETFISYPGCESDEDGEPVYGWAGWDHLQRAQALASLYQNRKTDEGWDKERLTPMLAGLLELIPWVKQWHNEPNEEFGGLRMGDYFAEFLDGQCRELGVSHQDLEDWRPSKATRGGKKASKNKTRTGDDPE